MTHLSLFASLAGALMATSLPGSSLAVNSHVSADLDAAYHTARIQNRWLAQFGADARVEPLCSATVEGGAQILSSNSCAALAGFNSEPARASARSLRVAHLKRDRAFWAAISRRDRRILEQYEVVVVGEARAVAAKTGAPR